ncbi:DinB family protein [Serinibacter arcticus]|uniref:DinB family protein n=1 Tax=Serinibacter arcticus TaxID=1655435 RepID=UPI002E2578AC
MIDEQGRPEPPLCAGEAETLLGFLDFHRATLAWKTSGLDAAGLAATTAASTLTLGGLLKHLTFVEDFWFGVRLAGREPADPWRTAPWDADPDWDLSSAVDDSPEQLRELWDDAVARSREITAATLADTGLDTVERGSYRDGSRVNLRWILVHLVEEYSRHNGHADLLREAVDGLRGE